MNKLAQPLPEIGDVISYRTKRSDGIWHEGTSIVTVLWTYDDLPIINCADGANIHVAFGDTWEGLKPEWYRCIDPW
jgi:hypothetical protein